MGYRIDYASSEGKRTEIQRRKINSKFLILSLCAIVLFALFLWPDGRMAVVDFFLPGDGAVTADALETFASCMEEGVPLEDAVQSFCLEILHDGAA